jgi:hypothetical protein
MLKLFGRNADVHPMADPKEAQRIFAELRQAEPAKAVEEIAHWAESVTTADGLKLAERLDLIKQLDDASQPHRVRTAREYGAVSRQSRFREQAAWRLNHDLWMRLADGYWRVASGMDGGVEKGADALKGQHGLVACRALRAQSMRLKWIYIRYGPIGPDIWQRFGALYRFAERNKCLRNAVTPYPAIAQSTTPEQELLRSLVLAASAPDALTPPELDMAERLVAHFVPNFVLTERPQPESTYWFDVDVGRPPTRLAAPPSQITPGLRLFSCVKGHNLAEQLNARILGSGEIPREVDLGLSSDQLLDTRPVLDVLQHLHMMWAAQPPLRKSPRLKMQVRMAVVGKFDNVVQVCKSADGATGHVDIDLDFGGSTGVHGTMESWLVDNISQGGFGATVPPAQGDWLQVGRLVAVQSEGKGDWDVALLRRISRHTGNTMTEAPKAEPVSVGVQVVSRKARSANFFDINGMRSNQPLSRGLYMDDAGNEPGVILACLPNGLVNPGERLYTVIDGVQQLLMPVGTTERGDDYEMIQFRAMSQQA